MKERGIVPVHCDVCVRVAKEKGDVSGRWARCEMGVDSCLYGFRFSSFAIRIGDSDSDSDRVPGRLEIYDASSAVGLDDVSCPPSRERKLRLDYVTA